MQGHAAACDYNLGHVKHCFPQFFFGPIFNDEERGCVVYVQPVPYIPLKLSETILQNRFLLSVHGSNSLSFALSPFLRRIHSFQISVLSVPCSAIRGCFLSARIENIGRERAAFPFSRVLPPPPLLFDQLEASRTCTHLRLLNEAPSPKKKPWPGSNGAYITRWFAQTKVSVALHRRLYQRLGGRSASPTAQTTDAAPMDPLQALQLASLATEIAEAENVSGGFSLYTEWNPKMTKLTGNVDEDAPPLAGHSRRDSSGISSTSSVVKNDEESKIDDLSDTSGSDDDGLKPPNDLYERYLLRIRTQREGESLDAFLEALKRQAENCDFGQFAEAMVRDQFIFGSTRR
ncbi:hypothetical protein HPB48_013096 [Haemaphysalis longicornis]|uniref:Uncharacterized protein n=1 Tax=Haemaphysalis longicornis TaxID=44386 RepID=A0A9J6FVK6_HAELO|nr:hypothetical protein HPB48_013096 [Haemaphysalis longicornis]